jgi:hypothetical protein
MRESNQISQRVRAFLSMEVTSKEFDNKLFGWLDNRFFQTLQPKRSWFRFSLRRVALVFVGLALLFAYAGSYYRVSRRHLDEYRIWDSTANAFFYAPIAEIEATHDLRKHYMLKRFYAPANYIDREWFGGPSAIVGVTWGD